MNSVPPSTFWGCPLASRDQARPFRAKLRRPTLLRSLLHSVAKERSATPFLSATSALFAKTGGCHPDRFSNSSTDPSPSRKSRRIRTYRHPFCNPFRIRTYKKSGGGIRLTSLRRAPRLWWHRLQPVLRRPSVVPGPSSQSDHGLARWRRMSEKPITEHATKLITGSPVPLIQRRVKTPFPVLALENA